MRARARLDSALLLVSHGLVQASSVGVLALALGVLACEEPVTYVTRTASSSKPEGPKPAAPAASAAPAAPAAAGGSAATVGSGAAGDAADAPPESFVRQSASARLVAIGDVHGDLRATRAALRLAGAIDDGDRWIGKDLTLVQTGDQLDRGDDERQIVDLFERLAREARAAGGRVVALNGNHETMNVQGDFRYITPAGFRAFEGLSPKSPLAASAPAQVRGRAEAFLPGGSYALVLAQRDVIAVIDDSVFVHGGVLPEHVTYGLERINQETRAWMLKGDRAAPGSIASETAPVWVRDYSLDPVSPDKCATLSRVLDALKVKRMVVGHTVQQRGITSGCNERVWRIDVGLARYYGANPISVLEINAGAVRVLAAPR